VTLIYLVYTRHKSSLVLPVYDTVHRARGISDCAGKHRALFTPARQW